ncbi:MAG: hypothetical protein Kow00127_19790 [Bacteroidales bacterium]
MVVLLTGCFAEYRLAREFIRQPGHGNILLVPANYTERMLPDRSLAGDTSGMLPDQVDSVLLSRSAVIRFISDSIFLTRFTNKMIDELILLGYDVALPGMGDQEMIFENDSTWLFSIARILFEEYQDTALVEDFYGGRLYSLGMPVLVVNMNFWFELSPVNSPVDTIGIWYASRELSDRIEGYFFPDPATGEISFRYSMTPVDTALVYTEGERMGALCAGYLYDLMMNRFIHEHWEKKHRRPVYMRYNRDNNTLDPAGPYRLYPVD